MSAEPAPFALDGDYAGDLLPAPPAKPKKTEQLSLLPVYVDVQRPKTARHNEPTIMDWLADQPKKRLA